MATQAAAVTPIAKARTQTATDRQAVGSPSFFKKPAGIAVLVTLAAGDGYALYSTQHDRIHSAGKK